VVKARGTWGSRSPKLLQHQFATTFLYITHDQSEALVMSDQVAVMSGGRFEQVGTPQELFLAPATAFVTGFVGDSNRWEGRLVEASGRMLKAYTESGTLVGVAGNAAMLSASRRCPERWW
jgi:spermidine/putrescine transport system ATP-binding protein